VDHLLAFIRESRRGVAVGMRRSTAGDDSE